MASNAAFKCSILNKSIGRYILLSVMAGLYIGIGAIFAYIVGADFFITGNFAGMRISMGSGLTIGLLLIVFAGGELFTGNTMIMTIGALNRTVSWKYWASILIMSLVGNWIGASLAAAGAYIGNMFVHDAGASYLSYIAEFKTTMEPQALISRSIMGNILVCLALWASSRTKEDISKIAIIFICVITLVGSGYEHCIVNMAMLGLSVFNFGIDVISIDKYVYNVIVSSIGNTIGGAFVVGFGYWAVSTQNIIPILNRKDAEK